MPISYKQPIEIVVLDIEGTVCPISFVKTTLFPYFLDKLPKELKELKYPITGTEKTPVSEICSQFPETHTGSYASLLEYITALVKNDIKDPVLKSLQGLIWKLGYENGDLKAPVYEDAIEFIEEKKGSKKVYIYSSGSIKAQVLLFGHVKQTQGGSVDLNKCLSGYYDITTAGFKQDSSSYHHILEDIGYSDRPKSVLFLSDNVKEVHAALEAGMNSVVVDRPGNAALTEQERKTFDVIENFNELQL